MHRLQSSSAIFHLGAYANYTLPYSAHCGANLVGLLKMLESIDTGRLRPMNYTFHNNIIYLDYPQRFSRYSLLWQLQHYQDTVPRRV